MIKTHKQWMIETIESCKTRGRIQAASSAERLLEKFAGRVDETYGALSEEIANKGIPEGASAHQMLVTDAEGVAKWEERPYYRTTEKVHLNDVIGEQLLPLTLTTVNNSGINMTQSKELGTAFTAGIMAGQRKYEVWFDGEQYVCEIRNANIGATITGDSVDFSEYPFAIEIGMNNAFLITESAGNHTIDIYAYVERTVSNYGNVLRVETAKSDGVYYLKMEDVEKIKAAWENNIPILINDQISGLGSGFHVTYVTDYFIYAISAMSGKGDIVMVCMKTFDMRDGSIYKESVIYGGSITENANKYPLMYINNIVYKIDVNDSGTLTATQLT